MHLRQNMSVPTEQPDWFSSDHVTAQCIIVCRWESRATLSLSSSFGHDRY